MFASSNYKCKIKVMRKVIKDPKMTLQVTYDDGRVETSTDVYYKIKSRFYDLVKSCLEIYVKGIKEIALIDSGNRKFKSFNQYF